ncbi:MAG: class I tRNA ligase family protein, partial [Lentisphaerae bacterium]|nr:class I tRNA ligase family protein [Lentisphaerota bacterium]
DRAAFKNCLVHGTLLAEEGGKISKSKKNFTDPMELIERYGADALRLYLLGSPAVVMEDLNFKDAGVRDQVKGVLLPLWNAFSFFVTYANVDQYTGDEARQPESDHPLDKWILARLYRARQEVGQAFKTFYLKDSLAPVTEFIEDLTNWYIRQSRARFWGGGLSAAKRQAYDTLYYALVTLLKLLAPSAPFVAEHIYRELTGAASVHLAAWPEVPESYRNDKLIEETLVVRTIVSLGLALRQKCGLRVRQPLPGIKVALPSSVKPDVVATHAEVIKSELNVKAVTILAEPGALATLRATPNPRVLGPKWGHAVQAIIRAAKAGQVREKGGQIVVFEGAQEWAVDRQDLELSYQGRNGQDVLSDKGILLSLDTTMTSVLREEGIANELNRIIQDLRKEAGYAVSDRIVLTIEGQLEDAWRAHLARLALAEPGELNASEADATARATIAGRPFRISIRK